MKEAIQVNKKALVNNGEFLTVSQNYVNFVSQTAEISWCILTRCHGHCQRVDTDFNERESTELCPRRPEVRQILKCAYKMLGSFPLSKAWASKSDCFGVVFREHREFGVREKGHQILD